MSLPSSAVLRLSGQAAACPPPLPLRLLEPATPELVDRVSAGAPDRTSVGVAAMLLSTLLFPMSDMLSKTMAQTYSGLEVTWIRFVVLLAAVIPFVLRRPGVLRAKRPSLQIARGVFSATATSLALVGFMFLPVANATAIGFCTPIIVTALAAVLLHERVGWQRWLAAVVGFGGILVIVQPGAATFQVATLLPLASSLFSAGTVITTRAGREEQVETTVIWSALVGFAGTSVAVAAVWRGLDAHAVLLGLIMGLLAAAASVLQVLAYRCAPASLIAPFSYAQILWAIGLGWLTFGTVPSLAMLAGSAIVIASGCVARRTSVATAQTRDWRRLRRELARLHSSRHAAA